jgi:peptide/nickel transport system permease protein
VRPTTHLEIARARLGISRRFRLGVVVLGLLALFGLFADLLASGVPLVARGRDGDLVVLPAIFERDPARRADLTPLVSALVVFGPEDASAAPLDGPSALHPFGTDERGRDVFARVAFGARAALGPALAAVALSMLLGIALGGAAGQVGGTWSRVLERLVQTVDTFPAILVVAIARAIEREPSALSLVLGVAAVRWAEVARLVRAEVLRERGEEYLLAARALGASPTRIFTVHVLRNAIGPVLVSSVFGVASVVLLEAALSFLALGSPVRQASWGETLAQAARHPDQLHLLIPPALALMATLGASYLVADALRDAVDPRTVRTTRPLSLRATSVATPLASEDRGG